MRSIKTKLLFSLLIFLFFFSASYAQQQVLLIGTFHFDNPGLDAAKLRSLDIKSPAVQSEINTIVAAIARYHPDQIFVEYSYQKQAKLDSLYADYLAGKPVSGMNDKSEVYQIAFKSAKALGLVRLNAIDYKMDLRGADSLMKVIQQNNQEVLMKAIQDRIHLIAGNINTQVTNGTSLTEMILSLNTRAYRDSDLGFYTGLFTKAGEPSNFIGPDVAGLWYKRNLYMFSLLQKAMVPKDQKIMVLLGASHIAVLQSFFKLDPAYKIVELKDILNK